MKPLIHITSPENALSILRLKSYFSNNNTGHYDAGMNFLGVLGEYSNTQPTRGAEIHCEWGGDVSEPLPPYANSYHTPNKLFDFNGSGNHYTNNDPRYFLPYGSGDLVVKKIVLESGFNKASLVERWAQFKGGIYAFLHRHDLAFNWLLKQALKNLDDVNEQLASKKVTISVQRGVPQGK